MKKIGKVLLIVFFIGIITGCGCNSKKKTIEVHKKPGKKISASQKVDSMDLVNGDIFTNNGIYYFTVQVRNNTNKDYNLEEYEITLYNKVGKRITVLSGYIGETIKAGETKIMTASTETDLTSAVNVAYKVIK